jgi:hypothetical protein
MSASELASFMKMSRAIVVIMTLDLELVYAVEELGELEFRTYKRRKANANITVTFLLNDIRTGLTMYIGRMQTASSVAMSIGDMAAQKSN